jgi:hypothetical protein
MMRFPIKPLRNEQNDKLCSENAYDVFATIPRIELGLKQAEAAAVVYPPRSIRYESIFPDIAKGVKSSEN